LGALSLTAAARYDRIAQLLIPGYSSLARLGVALLATSPLGAMPGASILVAGCGTGAELLEARRQRPDWRLTAIDPSPAMLAAARERLTSEQDSEQDNAGEGITWQDTRLEDLDSSTGFDGFSGPPVRWMGKRSPTMNPCVDSPKPCIRSDRPGWPPWWKQPASATRHRCSGPWITRACCCNASHELGPILTLDDRCTRFKRPGGLGCGGDGD